MPAWLTGLLPAEGLKIILVLFLSFLVGLQREEHRAEFKGPEQYAFGGVRTFPLLGLIGYAADLISGGSLIFPAVGFAVIGSFLWLSYQHKLATLEYAGATTEISGLAVYLVGVLVSRGEFWIATTIAIVSVLLLELKTVLENLSRRSPGEEILAFTKFLLLTAVILPVMPNRTFGTFGFNPFKAWLIVVAASGISYGSYLVEKASAGRGGVFLSALLGGTYSSTVTTVILAKRAREAHAPGVLAGGILMSSAIMYLRLLILLGIFDARLAALLLLPFLAVALGGIVVGWFWARGDSRAQSGRHSLDVKNPLELSAAFLFALLFVVLLAASHYALEHLGRGGIYGLAAITGLTDIDPFVLGMTQSAGQSLTVAAHAIAIAASSNNVVKGFYALGFADRKTGKQALGLLAALALAGLAPLLF